MLVIFFAYYLVFYLAKTENSPKAISRLIKLVNMICGSLDKNIIYSLFKVFQRGAKLFKKGFLSY